MVCAQAYVPSSSADTTAAQGGSNQHQDKFSKGGSSGAVQFVLICTHPYSRAAMQLDGHGSICRFKWAIEIVK
jgi:hypothetical protein